MTPNLAELIRRKRDGGALGDGEIRYLIAGCASGELPDYQLAALLMAIYFRGLSAAELGSWTDAMIHSGDVVDLSSLPGVRPGTRVDKHSTGGVGDMISLPLAPLLSCCGVVVPMISGRGLGHTGGTLDKLESIPGFRTDLSIERFRAQLGELGVCLIGQTERLAPADRRLYALRDVTGTVESVPLIASSIMSKKLAEGIDALVLDVKVGAGAFMKSLPAARELARTLVAIGTAAGKRVSALLTAMEQPLGRYVGNALEVREAVRTLRGAGSPDVRELTFALGAEMLRLAGIVDDGAVGVVQARARMQQAIDSGAALSRFADVVAAQGGQRAAVLDEALPAVEERAVVASPRRGVVGRIDAEAVGMAAIALGAGRLRKEDAIDPAVGIELLRKVGDAVAEGEPLCALHHRGGRGVDEARARLAAAYTVGDEVGDPGPLILEVLS